MKGQPTYESATTKIWRNEEPNDDPFGLAQWIVFAPWVHPLWSYHFVGIVHLRDVEPHPPANLQFEGATHEFMVLSLDPNHEPQGFDSLKYLMPQSIAQQFTATNDAEALEWIELLLDNVLNQKLSIDSDNRSQWKHLLTEHKIEDFR